MSPGSWSVTLKPGTPRSIIDALKYFQHVVISTGRHNPQLEGSSLFASGRFTGMITGLDFQTLNQGRGPVISGDCMASWLGNGSKVGPVIEGNNTPGSSGNGAMFTSASYATVVNTLVGVSSLKVGTIYPMPTSATFTGGFIWKTVADAMTSFASQVTQGSLPTQIAEWRANNTGTVDFGPVASLYRTKPITAIVPNSPGLDMSVRGLDGVAELIEDVKDYTTRVVVLASGTGTSTAVGAANSSDVGASNPYTDFYGNPVAMVRMISASGVSSVNATVSAQAALIPYATPADQVRLSSSEYDIKGDLVCGDYVWLYDPDSGFIDTSGANEIVYRGQRINPTVQRVIQVDWPITSDMTVAYRGQDGTWYDLTDYVQFEDGSQTNLTVGGYNRNLVPTSEPVGSRPIPDTTIPGVPVFGTFFTTVYQGPSDGKTQAQIQLNWSTPANTDGTTMTDLDHYEVQYRPDVGIYTVNPSYTALNAAGYTYNSLAAAGGSYNQLLPAAQADWKVTFVAGGVNNLLVQELTPGVEYEFQIRAVDTANPPNQGAWSPLTVFQANVDTIPPPAPDAPTVAANMASVQVIWDCGTSDGGTYTQAADLNHVEVHGSYAPTFIPSTATKLGNMPANIGNITGQIPVVGSFTIPPGQPPANTMYVKLIAVDTAGNKSAPSQSAGATAVLWSDAYVTDLSVSKLTAGTITADVILGGQIATGSTGQRCVMDSTGYHSYDSSGNLLFDVSNDSSQVTLGAIGGVGKVVIDTNASDIYPQIRLYDQSNSNYAFILGSNLNGNTAGIAISSGTYQPGSTLLANRLTMDGSGCRLQVIDATNGAGQAVLGGTVNVSTTGVSALVENEGAISGGAMNITSSGFQASFQTGGGADGGVAILNHTNSIFGLFVSGATHGGQLRFDYDSGNSDAKWEMDGYLPNWSGAATQFGLMVGNVSGLGAGAGGGSLSYGPTMYSSVIPVASYSCGTLGTIGGNVNALTTTGMALTLSGTSPASWSILFWATRVR